MASIIKTLKTYLTNKTIYPRTVTQAVYDSEGKRLDTILGKTDISAISDGTVTGAIAAVSNKADKNEESIITVEAIAKGRNQARVFSTTESMENWLSDSANKGVANVGDNLYIVAVDVPDWWISSVLEAPNESGMYYEIAQLETQKVDLTTIENAINSIDSKIGSTDISSIGDGTVTGGLDALNSNLGNCFIISPEYSDTVPSGTTNYYEPILTASIPDGYKLFGITGLRASSASIYFYSSGRRLTYNQIQIGLKSVDTSDLSGVVYLYRFIFIKENMISIH